MAAAADFPFDSEYSLDDKYTAESGRVFITGVQALVRLPLMQRARDRAAGLNTRGFISGYRGSPLGTYDMALWQAKGFLEANDVDFQPGLNEDLAATSVWGTQNANMYGNATVDGVFSIWYGKGPGVDRSVDALKHGSFAGAAPRGGVLVLCGDDPGAKSSSTAHQSEHALVHMGIPMLNPANVQDYLDFGIFGWALSRYSGCWVGMKCLTDTVESGGSVWVGADRVQVQTPDDFALPEAGLNIGVTYDLLSVERRQFDQRLPAAQAFARANGIDRVALDSPERRLGIVTTGKAYLDLRQALEELEIPEQRAHELGLSIYKVGMSWPLEPQGARAFCRGLEEVLVVEEKRGLVEEQLSHVLYNDAERPRIVGKRDADGRPLIPQVGELSPSLLVEHLRRWLERTSPRFAETQPRREVVELPVAQKPAGLTRMPAFCSGCPHNTSTNVPEGSVAGGGIGCHGMAVWTPGRRTIGSTHMGGEGATWIGTHRYCATNHIFQNMGDGTYFHSGYLAIRAAVAADVNITYKILVNGAVAMTGGQPIEGQPMDGAITAPEIARQLAAEGIKRIAVLSNDIEKYDTGQFPSVATIHPREELEFVQKQLREVPGVTALIYDQTCAAEARRLRKRGEFDDPDRRIVINERVCEGCGDCSVQSNCISVEPVETEFGRKRRINQSSCNKDYSCVKGHCPSFVSVYGGTLRKAAREAADTGGDAIFEDLPMPTAPSLEEPFNVLVTGIGGTGVITVGALIGMAAHLEGRGCSVLDVTGLAQKNGPVTSHIRVAEKPEALHATRISKGAADLVLGCDIVVATGVDALAKMSPGRTTAVVNSHVAPTADFAANPDLDLSSKGMEDAIRAAGGEKGLHAIAATPLATALLGDAIGTNLFLVGYAFQLGRLPVGLGALMRAIELNGRGIEMNKRAFQWGRLAAFDLERVRKAAAPLMRGAAAPGNELAGTLDELLAVREPFLVEYQNKAYARRYRKLVDRTVAREQALGIGRDDLSRTVARYFFKLLAIKDEYEVARLYSDGDFVKQLEQQFEGDYRIELHLAPPRIPVIDRFVNRIDAKTGRRKKLNVGPWALQAFGVLAKLKFLRGTIFDFGNSPHRKLERQLAADYEREIIGLLEELNTENYDTAVQLAALPEIIRGYDEIKERGVDETREKREELMQTFRMRAGSA